jgi:DNA segregation ATPase FtsK/SpoIIIE-like protein
LRPMVKHASEVLGVLQYLRSIMEQRLGRFEAAKAKNLASFNAKSQTKVPRIVLIIDEMATLLGLDKLTSDIHTELRVLSSQGRAVGIHLVLCTQHSSVDVLPGWVKTNMVLRISGKMPSHQASMVILDSVTAATLPNIPGRLVFSVGRYEVIAQSPFISDSEIERAVSLSKAFPAPDNSEFAPDISSDETEEASDESVDELHYQIVSMVLSRFEGRLSEKKIHEALGKDVITMRQLREIIKSIIEEAKQGIAHDGSIYTVKRDGRAYVLIQQTTQPETEEDTQELEPLHHGDVVSEEATTA